MNSFGKIFGLAMALSLGASASLPNGTNGTMEIGPADVQHPRLQNIGLSTSSEPNCYASLYDGEEYVNRKGTDDDACIGGQSGGHYEGHAPGQSVESFTLWPWGGEEDGATGLSWQLTDKQEFTIGEAKKESCSFKFRPGDHIVGDIGMHGNGIGTRFGRLEFNVRRGDTGEIEGYACGHEHTRYSFPADGMVIAGFFGGAGWEIDSMGIILKKPDCSVISREIVDMQCTNPVDGDKQKCDSVWTDEGTTANAHASCDWCGSSNDGICGAGFTVTESHTATTTSTDIDETGGEISLASEFSLSLLGTGGKISETYSVHYSHSWQNSEAESFESTTQIASTCSVNMKPRTKTTFDSMVRVGHMTADIKITMNTKTRCGESDFKTLSGQVTISKVPITASISACTPNDVPCDANQTAVIV